MNQSTQVNFPIVSKSFHRKLTRHNSSADLINPQNTSIKLRNPRTQLRPQSVRPKSLNLPSTEALCRSNFNSKSPISRLSDPFGSILRERTPPLSCNSSIISNVGLEFKPPSCLPPKIKHHPLQHDEKTASTTTKCCCRCCDAESRLKSRKDFSNTTEGLSWRRLHMSRAKLKATATTSELLSGFAVIAMVELQIDENTTAPEWLFVVFTVCTTVLVAVHIFALLISTYILPSIEAIAKLEICEIVEESPHERLRGLIELAWAFTILGFLLFLVEVAILCWIKFWDYSFRAAYATTVIVVPAFIIFVLFAVHYYQSVVVFKCNSSISDMEKLENMKKQLDKVANTKIV